MAGMPGWERLPARSPTSGLGDEFTREVREHVTLGTSALFLMTYCAML
jgi:uncharacterized membrane protein